MYDVIVIGCGIVGAATAYELGKRQLTTLVLEAENDVSLGATRANSAILHAGYDPEPGTLMAKLNVEGANRAKMLCQKLSVHYNQIGSLVVAFSAEELTLIRALYERGVKNGVKELEILDQSALFEKEPNLSHKALGALYAPTAAIVNPWEFCLALAETAVKNDVEIALNNRVTAIKQITDGYEVTTNKATYQTKYIFNAAGVHSDDIHNLIAEPNFEIKPNRGEYYLLDKSEGTVVQHVVFQCPSSSGKGVLISPTVHGNLVVGPNSESIRRNDLDSGNDTGNTIAGLKTVVDLAKKSVPDLNLRQSIRNFSGVRANSTADDFILQEAAPGFIDLAGIKSPGLTAAPAIAVYAIELLEQAVGKKFKQKESYIDSREKIIFQELDFKEKNEAIAKNNTYGRVICRCETVTEGEIRTAVHSPIPPISIDGIKRRCNAGMGRCQGGFCGPRVVDILADELDRSPLDILQDREGSYVLVEATKGGR
ncbi:NAD(P)/FAD-dependent oxidoreductase [Enterococcus xiangfangensis]|uniref:NAD(P)/FAD-dependent oxidoreductase n=1 Tax=Enterococcus xiangfangensis TaxID=1296537 RepID=A0ABU3FCD0_9ENTE|nr:NAD(P)/FAD-dependent oxidoreductase [Enterococcus xiangfangensis]MDT2760329.1 NAD(P)/FAD-dependent oxidoreductase [Enterococcus xiangfangensis]